MLIRIWSIVVLPFIAFVVSFVKADTFSPSQSCRKPLKPYKFTSKWELENFNDDVRRFRSCIEAFVEEQEDTIKNHVAQPMGSRSGIGLLDTS